MKNSNFKNQVPVHESQDSDKVIKFINASDLKQGVQDLINNNALHGIYLNESGHLVAEDIWQDVHEDIEEEE